MLKASYTPEEQPTYVSHPDITEKTIAVCELKALQGINGVVGFVQEPGTSVTVAGIFIGGEQGDLLDLKVTEYGDITSKCTKLGNEFNPMSYMVTDPWGA